MEVQFGLHYVGFITIFLEILGLHEETFTLQIGAVESGRDCRLELVSFSTQLVILEHALRPARVHLFSLPVGVFRNRLRFSTSSFVNRCSVSE